MWFPEEVTTALHKLKEWRAKLALEAQQKEKESRMAQAVRLAKEAKQQDKEAQLALEEKQKEKEAQRALEVQQKEKHFVNILRAQLAQAQAAARAPPAEATSEQDMSSPVSPDIAKTSSPCTPPGSPGSVATITGAGGVATTTGAPPPRLSRDLQLA